ncbi:MAG: NACHT domain-containing protein [Hungatella sp.]|nr:NACHT domain-containing protein [Hungatella sp.]
MYTREKHSGEYEKVRDIIILETDKNKKGDLFNRLVYDVFHALGFERPRYNIPKPGREIDMVLQHRTENRVALVESKSEENKIGGSDVNKFAGAFEVERGKYEEEGSHVVGYFIAKSGFKETALEQEEERVKGKRTRNEKHDLILLGPGELVRELIQGKVICPLEKAVNAVERPDKKLTICEEADIIACEYGWIWVLYYSYFPDQAATHFTFIHADGNQLLNNVADNLLKQSCSKEYPFSKLNYIKAASADECNKDKARKAYFKYLENELGEIQFEGMPTDKEAGAVKVNLESIFVPLRFNYYRIEDTRQSIKRISMSSIKRVLERSAKAAILAKPGGGKSTLIRRIALAYAYPERRLKVDDGLPDKDWFPIYIRCRDLGNDVTNSIMSIISLIVNRAEIQQYEASFNALVEDMLQDGRMLLLVDGLDEISIEKDRILFVNQLRTFVATYPTVRLIITSREAGFRAVAGTMASYCEEYSIASLREEEIRELSLKWHHAILGESGEAEEESRKVCDIIQRDPRIITLAESPLLLTTLLFVKRWIGYLPTKRCQLYGEMVKLLLVTWNAAGHDKLDMDETEPQLAYVAYKMTTEGKQKITRDDLEKCIIESRRALPELLAYTTVSPSRFIDQVEERSSLLIQIGVEENDKGRLVPSYEFSHLSFQEYLTAKAVAELWIEDSEHMDLIKVLEPYINEDHWKEVIPLAAVLAGRMAKPLVEYLIKAAEKYEEAIDDKRGRTGNHPREIISLHLANCIASEVPMARELLEKAIVLILKRKASINNASFRFDLAADINVFTTILNSKYGNNYRTIVETNLFHNKYQTYLFEYCDAWLEICRLEKQDSFRLPSILQLLKAGNYQDEITGALLMMQMAFSSRSYKENESVQLDRKLLKDIFQELYGLLQRDDFLSIYSASWSIAWSGYDYRNLIPYQIVPEIAAKLIERWVSDNFQGDLKRVISWGVASVCMPGLEMKEVPGLKRAIECNLENPETDKDINAAVHVAVLTGYWTEEEAKEHIERFISNNVGVSEIQGSRFLGKYFPKKEKIDGIRRGLKVVKERKVLKK